MKTTLSKVAVCLYFFFILAVNSQSLPQMKYRILVADEANKKVHYFDLSDTANKWSVSIGTRDMQLIGNGKILVHSSTEIAEYDLNTHSQTRKLSVGNGIQTAFRINHLGETFIGVDGSKLKIIDSNGNTRKTINISSITSSIRLIRPTMKNTFLVGSGGSNLCEFDETGGKVWEVNVGGTPYQAVRLPNGNTVISTGYAAQIVVVNSKSQIVRRFPADPKASSLNLYRPYFFAGFQILKNGNVVVSNWQGHIGSIGNGMSLLEFDSTGVLVSCWKHPSSVGSLHGVIVLDGIDISKMNSDINGVLSEINQTGIVYPNARQTFSFTPTSHKSSSRVFDVSGRLVLTERIGCHNERVTSCYMRYESDFFKSR